MGAACSLTVLKDTLNNAVSCLPVEKTKLYRALLQQLKTLGGAQIRNTAVSRHKVNHATMYNTTLLLCRLNLYYFFQSLGGNIISRSTTSDLNPVLAAGGCILNLASKGTLVHEVLLFCDFHSYVVIKVDLPALLTYLY